MLSTNAYSSLVSRARAYVNLVLLIVGTTSNQRRFSRCHHTWEYAGPGKRHCPCCNWNQSLGKLSGRWQDDPESLFGQSPLPPH